MSEGGRFVWDDLTVTLEVGGRRITLTGREAAAVADFALSLERIRQVRYGTVRHELTPTSAQTFVTDAGQTIHVKRKPG